MSSGKYDQSHLSKKRIKLEDLEGEEPEAILGDLNQDSDSDLSETWSEFGETLFISTSPTEPKEEPEDQPYHEPEEEIYEPPGQEEPMDEPEVKIPQKTVQPRKRKRGKKRLALSSTSQIRRNRRLKRLERLQNDIKPVIYEELPHVCSVCSRRFDSEKHLHSHLEKHQQTPTCPACSNSIEFITMSDLKDHLLSCPSLPAFMGSIDLVQRPYLCIEPNCFKSYANKVTLGFHMKGPHFSSIRETKWDPNLSVKRIQKHRNLDEPRPFICDECGASYKSSHGLYLHVRSVHLKIRYKCTFPGCDASLSARSALNKHIKEFHSNKDAYICKHCGVTYKGSQGLNYHIKSRHLKLKLDCTYPGCDKKFSYKNSLRLHLKTFHNGKKLPTQDASNHESEFQGQSISEPRNTPEKIVCQYCGLLYHQRFLRSHQRARHFDSLSPEEQAECVSRKVLDESKGRLVSKNTIYVKKKKLMSQEELRAVRERKIRREGLQRAGETLDDTIARLDQEKEEREKKRKEDFWAKRAAETEEEREERRAKYRDYQKEYIEKNRDKINEYTKNYYKKLYHNPNPEEKAKILARASEYQRRRWAKLTPEQKKWKNRKKSKDFANLTQN